MAMAASTKNATEHAEQVNFFQGIRRLYREFPDVSWLTFAIPNGGERHPAVAARLAAEGVMRGIPDIFCAVAREGYHGLFIEMKKKQGGRISRDQKIRMAKLSLAGYLCVVARGADEAENILEAYVRGFVPAGVRKPVFAAQCPRKKGALTESPLSEAGMTGTPSSQSFFHSLA